MINWKNFEGFFTTGIPSEILYPLLLLALGVITAGMFSKRVKNKTRYLIWVLLLVYLIVLICSTVICRKVIVFDFGRLQLIPFWTYKAIIFNTTGVSVWDIVLNVALFMPLGFLVKLIYPSLSLLKMLGIALICSLFVETNQYIFEKGVAQTDDVMHNSIGALIGWLLATITLKIISKQKSIT